jgi:alkanesulfonate monooxygenase SsuD/methylene tetrahydromethanopterin reductase-like flavin-dependent oxidoreductase (luciferase family)
MSRFEFYLFGYGSYPNIPHSDELQPKSAYIDLPGTYCEPMVAHKYLESYFDMLTFGEKLGFDGILTTAQMGGPIGLTPGPNISGAYLAAKTERIRIGVVGPILNAYQNPMRAVEELAMLDQMSGGRLICGLPMGHGQNWHAMATANPTHARGRHWEAHDLMVKAWTTPGPFSWEGRYFNVPYANLWPRPIQPTLPVWIPAAGSKITLEKCAEHHYTYQTLFAPRKQMLRGIKTFRETTQRFGYEADPNQLAVVLFIHVAESDAQARLEAEPHLMWVFQNANRAPMHDAFPPGHFSVDSLRGFLSAGGYRSRDIGDLTYDELQDEGWVIIGSPETVARKLEETSQELGAGRVVYISDFGAMPNWMMRKSLTMFAEEVMPKFRAEGAQPVWAVHDQRPAGTFSELGARIGEPPAVPQARVEGVGVLDVRTAHVADLREPLRP